MARNALHGDVPEILLMAVMRFSDKTIVASFQNAREVTVEGVRECIAGSANIELGKRYTSQGPLQSIHYEIDAQGRVFALVANPKFSVRVSFLALDELVNHFSQRFGGRIATAREGELSREGLPVFRSIFDRFFLPIPPQSITLC